MGRYERVEPKKEKKSKKGLLIGLVVVLLLVLAAGGYQFWHYRQPKFQDVTIELGTDSVSMGDFMTKYAWPKRVGFVSDIGQVDLNRVGAYDLTLRHGDREETIRLTIQDTTAPQVRFLEHRTVTADYEPKPEDFVEAVEDLSGTTVAFDGPVLVPNDYADTTATVVVMDEHGNETRKDCTLSWVWLRESYTLELGDELTKEKLLIVPERDESLLDQSDLDAINKGDLGEYTLLSATSAKSMSCVVTVQDTRGPTLKLKKVSCKPKGTVKLKNFISKAEDPSGEVELKLLTEISTKEKGSFPVTIEARDKYGNVTTGETMLYVTTDSKPPVLTGVEEMLEIKKGETPDYLKGVKAEDKESGECEVTCDSSAVDLTKSGTYFVTYKTADAAGNEVKVKRTVLVLPDEADIEAMVKEIAADLPKNAEKLRNYVRDSFGYNSNWGGTYPVWYGFTNKNGNCYVHALCLKALYDEKGIESQLIWCTDKSHYWLVVNIDGRWLHIDPTPGPSHSKYSLMTDWMRKATLNGRTWESGKWPVCK